MTALERCFEVFNHPIVVSEDKPAKDEGERQSDCNVDNEKDHTVDQSVEKPTSDIEENIS